ncbi:MAG: hypothetical protein IJA02_11530 [Clostridia bacterium]|nr:hypothetical protein [Clostridia bacterium]
MRRICLLFLVLIFLLSLVACKSETVTLHCDRENCDNTVEVKVEKDNVPDESWIIFCQDCADNVLDD